MDLGEDKQRVSIDTATKLGTVAKSLMASHLSQLSLPEVETIVEQVAQLAPAGNVPAVILNGLTRLPERRPPPKIVKRDINLLFRGVEQALDTATYSTVFAGPAAIIWAYQNLLKLAGKDPDDAFPEGTWQFYVDYAMREDTARHVNESHGFDTLLNQHGIRLSKVDRATAWIMAAIHCLHQYHELLRNEWRERVYISLLREVTQAEPEAKHYAQLYHQWEQQRPYDCGPEAQTNETYPQYRRRRFDQFLKEATAGLRDELRQKWVERIRAAIKEQWPAYQQQMSILAYLDPGVHGETRVPIPLQKIHLGLIYQGRYYLIPICAPQSEQPAEVTTVRTQIAALMAYSSRTPAVPLTPLARMKRAEWLTLRQKLAPACLRILDALRFAPILLNCDRRPCQLTLAEVRQAERGIGHHALTLFDTGETMVFDQSHIFFDGAWGATLAEIMTNEAVTWAVYLSQLPPVTPRRVRLHVLNFQLQEDDLRLIQKMPAVTPEASAESEAVNLKAILRLRRLFKQRSDLLQLTVNDLLILYRAMHAVTYQPDPAVSAALQALSQAEATRPAALATLEAIASSTQLNPAMVIPVDASQHMPQDRLHPLTFEVPLTELNLINLHQQTMAALAAYKTNTGDRTDYYETFNKLQRSYLARLAGFGMVLSQAKEIAILGKSDSVVAMKLMAHLPTPLQRMLDKVPDQFDMLNDLIKGREVFSNVGAVVPSSTLTRFMTAKDDNDKKTLAWGVLTDANKVMRISLRDFRPHVALLQAIGRQALANQITQDYLNSYAHGLNQFIHDLQQITETSRETRLTRLEQKHG